ncbi:MAG: hypothetical protein U5L95_00080 [Candidatus Saccharibacteria bacterium]|nr:hypothetical protein [Candidatus Saccharibacteria bacterium]
MAKKPAPFETLAQLKDDIKEQLQQEKNRQAGMKYESDLSAQNYRKNGSGNSPITDWPNRGQADRRAKAKLDAPRANLERRTFQGDREKPRKNLENLPGADREERVKASLVMLQVKWPTKRSWTSRRKSWKPASRH